MELKDFVAQTLIQVAEGVNSAREHLDSSKGQVSVGKDSAFNRKPVQFDVAIGTTSETSSMIGGKITVATIFKAGTEQQESETTHNISRIKFDVWLQLH